MLPCVKQLLIIFVFTSIVDGKKKYEKNKKNNSDQNGICQTLAEYYNQKMFKKSVTSEFFNSVGKDARARIFKVKKKKSKRKKQSKSSRTETCFDSLDYKQFNEFYINKEKEYEKWEMNLKLVNFRNNLKLKRSIDYN
ncbi:uncharacterized protein LOC113558492 isoform X2 [Rhopalosiphum maidis]|uniref:uncharacterized protein LOC113558492 isoform X2 n=1 Tax=Rhopalosiphum maidis TaxID=43146 RepID=UPI000EFED792|nr:uncharacterized protein LOC113558492 isoform X2 [Rhopalosiphum maidis]